MSTDMNLDARNHKFITVIQANATGSTAIDHQLTVDADAAWKLDTIMVHFSTAPTTSEDLTIKIDSALGAAYDTVIYKVDPSTVGANLYINTNQFGNAAVLRGNDKLVVAFANSDSRTWGLDVTLEGV